MKAIVVYESMFGNTERVASAIADGLRRTVDTDLVEIGSIRADAAGRVDLLVVGGPTQGFSLSRKASKGTAAKVPPGREFAGGGLREWIEALPDTRHVEFVAFDTRFRKPWWLTGSAARAVASRLRRKGYGQIAPPESFFVTHAAGPLFDGEAARAKAWGGALGERFALRPAA